MIRRRKNDLCQRVNVKNDGAVGHGHVPIQARTVPHGPCAELIEGLIAIEGKGEDVPDREP
jgi:hypothetical protein